MTTWPIDKSALVRLGASRRAQDWATRIERGLVAISTDDPARGRLPARSAGDFVPVLDLPPIASMRVEHLTPALEDRGHSRFSAYSRNVGATAPSIPDLLNAATAELSGPTVLHLDEDFDLLAALTQQPTERLDN